MPSKQQIGRIPTHFETAAYLFKSALSSIMKGVEVGVCSRISQDVRLVSDISWSDAATDRVSRSDEIADSATSGCHDAGDSSLGVVVFDVLTRPCFRDLGFRMIAPLVAIVLRSIRSAGDPAVGGISGK